MGLKAAFNEICTRLGNNTDITTVYKGIREDIPPTQLPVAMVFSIMDEPVGGQEKASQKNANSIREYEIVVGLFWRVNDEDNVQEDALDWAKAIKDDLAGSSYRLGDNCLEIGFGRTFYHPRRQIEGDKRTWYEAGVEVHVLLEIHENYA